VIGKKCALKVLRGEMSTDSEVAERFLQEARSAAAIGNEHIIEITDFGQLPDNAPYFVMEFLDGAALHDVIEDGGQVDPQRTLKIMAQCCDALAAAHNSDIVHRDLKPDNIFLVKKGKDDDFVKVLDFGIAKVARESGRLTRTGMIFGTPQYMSPEQAAGTGVDARTDIYSLGIIMYEMLCGHVPFEADTFMGVLTKHLYEEPIPPRRLIPPVEVQSNVEAVLLKAIAKKPEKRYQSMEEFQEDLEALAEGRTPAIVFDQVRDTAATTVPPPPPDEVVGTKKTKPVRSAAKGGKPKWPIFAGIGAVVVIGAIAAVFLLAGSDKGQEAAANPVTPPTPVAEPAPAPAPAPAPVAPAPAPEAKTASTKVISDPEGAALYQGKAFMGQLPFDLVKPNPGDAPVHYTIKKDGYEDLDVMIAATTPEEFKITLTKVKKASSGGRKKTSGGGGAASGGGSGGSSGDKVIKVKKKKKKLGDLADPWG
jgi:serine/threonine-protein kinase